MKKRVVPAPLVLFYILFVLITLPVLSLLSAAQHVTVVKTPITYVSPSDGHGMFMSYCAACHGAEGAGNGRAAKALTIPPADLSSLNRRNGGKFPHMYVASVLRRGAVTPHGQGDMPVWSSLFFTLPDGENPALTEMRIQNLILHMKTLQKN
jgi:mono/diheme cytochrome c family protein